MILKVSSNLNNSMLLNDLPISHVQILMPTHTPVFKGKRRRFFLILNVSIVDFYCNLQKSLTGVTDGGRTCFAIRENVFANSDTNTN